VRRAAGASRKTSRRLKNPDPVVEAGGLSLSGETKQNTLLRKFRSLADFGMSAGAGVGPLPVVTPSVEVLSAFDRLARPTYKRIVECTRESRTLSGLRDTLLPRFISGELKIFNRDNILTGADA